MKLYILRHAIAEARRPGLAESKRPLTAEGVEELRAVVAGLRRLKVRPEIVFSSPYRRAWDTALVAARELIQGQPVGMDALKPEGSPERIWTGLREYPELRSAMVVGHEPLLSELAAFLLNSPRLAINLKKSGLIRLDVASLRTERPDATLRWLLTPGQLSRLA